MQGTVCCSGSNQPTVFWEQDHPGCLHRQCDSDRRLLLTGYSFNTLNRILTVTHLNYWGMEEKKTFPASVFFYSLFSSSEDRPSPHAGHFICLRRRPSTFIFSNVSHVQTRSWADRDTNTYCTQWVIWFSLITACFAAIWGGLNYFLPQLLSHLYLNWQCEVRESQILDLCEREK